MKTKRSASGVCWKKGKFLAAMILGLSLAAFPCPSPSGAAEPETLSYQGTLTDAGMNPLPDGSQDLRLCLYQSEGAAAGLPTDTPPGEAFWCSSYTVSLHNGQFSVVLGSTANPLPKAKFSGNVFLGLKVAESTSEMVPRQKLTSVAFALNGVPRGAIMMWTGANPPAGWVLCDGNGGAPITYPDGSAPLAVPDLRDRFVLGAGTAFPVGSAPGGSRTQNMAHTHATASTALTASQIPSHQHAIDHDHAAFNWTHDHDSIYFQSFNEGGMGGIATGAGAENHWPHLDIPQDTTPIDIPYYSGTSGPAGGGGGHDHGSTLGSGSTAQDVMPPYYVLAFIMKI